jgi:hypothetical protein
VSTSKCSIKLTRSRSGSGWTFSASGTKGQLSGAIQCQQRSSPGFVVLIARATGALHDFEGKKLTRPNMVDVKCSLQHLVA